uniref:Uncharacterized protein n=1 Tax=Arabidopsis thaliana TaxID=3702 RepID=Q56Y24_ARATH|nr:hypothetical protein [Arabidopsis thaliana]
MEMEMGSCKLVALVILIHVWLLEIRLLDCGFLARKSSSEELADSFEESSAVAVVAQDFVCTVERSIHLRFLLNRLRYSSFCIQLPVVVVVLDP